MSRRRRSGGRAARAAARAAAREMERSPFLTSKLKPFELLSTEGLEIIENNAEIIMERVGVDITDAQAVKDFAAAGADVDGTRVRFPPRDVPGVGHGHRSILLHPGGPQSRPVGGDRRPEHGPGAHLRVPVRP